MATAIDYGRDVSCTSRMRTGRLSSGVRLVAEAAYRRLITPRGMLRGGEDEANYGLDLTSLVGSIDPVNLAAALPDMIRAELKKDERIATVTTAVVVSTEGPGTVLTVSISCTTDEGATFTLKLAVSEVTVSLLGLEAA